MHNIYGCFGTSRFYIYTYIFVLIRTFIYVVYTQNIKICPKTLRTILMKTVINNFSIENNTSYFTNMQTNCIHMHRLKFHFLYVNIIGERNVRLLLRKDEIIKHAI